MTDRLLSLIDIIGNTKKGKQAIVPLSRTTIYQAIKNGEFPRPIKLGRRTFWRESEVQAFIERLGDK